jgi:hypothetical protein
VRPSFSHSQAIYRLFIVSIAGEVKSPEPLNGKDGAGGEELRCFLDHVIAYDESAICGFQPHLGAANRACSGLRVEAPVKWVLVFAPARVTQGEDRHGRIWPVIRDVGDDGKARTTVRAVGKGITKAAVVRVKEFLDAFPAGGYVRRNKLITCIMLTFFNLKGGIAIRTSGLELDVLKKGKWRSIACKSNRAMESAAPSTSISTLLLVLRTQPVRLCSWASLKMKGRKPTPCTTPCTEMCFS